MRDSPSSVTDVKPFIIPNKVLFTPNANNANPRNTALSVDDGIWHVDPDTFRSFNPSHRKRALKTAEILSSERMDELSLGMFIVLDFGPNSERHPWDFVPAEIDETIDHLDTTSKTTSFEVQV